MSRVCDNKPPDVWGVCREGDDAKWALRSLFVHMYVVAVLPRRLGAVPGSAGFSNLLIFSSEWYVTYFDLALA